MTRVIQLKLSFSNAYLVQGRKTILVDSGSPRESLKIMRALAGLGIEPRDFSLIVHTHAHFDHAGSTLELKRLIDVPTAVHQEDAAMLARGRLVNPLIPTGLEARLLLPFLSRQTFAGVKADVLFKEEIGLQEFGVNGKLIFTPGHTAGSISLLLDNNEAIIGDVIMGGLMGGNVQSSRPNYHYFAENLGKIHTSIKKIMAFKPKKLYVGHGGPLSAEAVLKRFSKIL
jgi:glyoxylase-like metal-dependent hydrolase (beta-lactamase superfamily II)